MMSYCIAQATIFQYPGINHNGKEYKKNVYIWMLLLLLSHFSRVRLCVTP